MARIHAPVNTPLRAGAAVATLTVIGWSTLWPVQAAEPGYEIQVGIQESDNIERLPSGGTSETIAFEELGFTWHDKRPWLDADIDADLSYLSFLQHTYDDEFIGNFIGGLRIKLAPDILSWDISENFGQARLDQLDPLSPITPNNRENINYFNTGPELSLPLGRQTQLVLIGQYGIVSYQNLPLNSTRFTDGVELVHDLSRTNSVSINVTDERVDFADDQLNPDYDRQEAFVRFDVKGGRTQLGLDLGFSQLDMSGDRTGSVLAHLDLSHRISTSSIIGVAFGHDYSDGADSFRLVQSLGSATLNTQSTVQSNAPFLSNYATLAWDFKRARTSLALSANYFQDRYQTAPTLDNNRVAINANASRQLSPVLQIALTEYMIRQQFISLGYATETDTGLQLTWRAGRNLSVIAAYYLSKSKSDIQADEYTENRLWLSIGYGRAADVPPGPATLRLPAQQ